MAYLVRVEFGHVSGFPEDVVTNTFCFENDIPVTTASFTDLVDDAILPFYTGLSGTQGTSLAARLSTTISRAANAVNVKGYEVPVVPGPLGSPDQVRIRTLAVAAGVGNALPSEVAAVISFKADITDILEEVGATRPRARRRGRLYLGPLMDNATDGNDDGPRVGPGFLDDVEEACQGLKTNATTAGWTWCVFSRTDWLAREVVSGHIDNAFDTVRSRGEAATARNAFTV